MYGNTNFDTELTPHKKDELNLTRSTTTSTTTHCQISSAGTEWDWWGSLYQWHTIKCMLMIFRNKVNRKFLPDLSPTTSKNRRVNETNAPNNSRSNQTRGRERGRRSNQGGYRSNSRGGRGRGRNRGTNRAGRADAQWVNGTDGKSIEVHPSYNFPPHMWNLFPSNKVNRINNERHRNTVMREITRGSMYQQLVLYYLQ